MKGETKHNSWPKIRNRRRRWRGGAVDRERQSGENETLMTGGDNLIIISMWDVMNSSK